MVTNYHHLQMYTGTIFRASIPFELTQLDLSTVCHCKYLAVMRSVFDSNIYHQMCVSVDVPHNSLVLSLPIKDTQQIKPGKYMFDIVSRHPERMEMINKVTEGIVYVYSTYSLEAFEQASKDIL